MLNIKVATYSQQPSYVSHASYVSQPAAVKVASYAAPAVSKVCMINLYVYVFYTKKKINQVAVTPSITYSQPAINYVQPSIAKVCLCF